MTLVHQMHEQVETARLQRDNSTRASQLHQEFDELESSKAWSIGGGGARRRRGFDEDLQWSCSSSRGTRFLRMHALQRCVASTIGQREVNSKA